MTETVIVRSLLPSFTHHHVTNSLKNKGVMRFMKKIWTSRSTKKQNCNATKQTDRKHRESPQEQYNTGPPFRRLSVWRSQHGVSRKATYYQRSHSRTPQPGKVNPDNRLGGHSSTALVPESSSLPRGYCSAVPLSSLPLIIRHNE